MKTTTCGDQSLGLLLVPRARRLDNNAYTGVMARLRITVKGGWVSCWGISFVLNHGQHSDWFFYPRTGRLRMGGPMSLD